MKAVFVHDHRFEFSDGVAFSPGKLPYSVLSRYVKWFGDLTVIGREGQYNNSEHLVKSSGNRVNVIAFPNQSTLKGMLGLHFLSESINKVLDSADVLIVRLPSELGFIFAREAKKRNIPIISEVVLCPQDALNSHGTLVGKLYAPFCAKKTKKVVKYSDAVLYVTKEYLQKKYTSQALTAGVSDVELDFIDNPATRIYKRTLVLGMLADLNSDIKGIDVAIRAVSHLRKKYGRDYKLLIAGPGEKIKWEMLCTNHGVSDLVEFRGSLNRSGVSNFFSQDVDLYLQPSFAEGLPRALVEAMSLGCLCIASSVGGIPELLEDDFLISPGDFQMLAQIIDRLYSMTETEKISVSNRNAKFSLNYTSEKLDSLRDNFYLDCFNKFKSVRGNNKLSK